MKVIYVLAGTQEFGGSTKSFLNLLDYGLAHGIDPVVVMPDRKGIYRSLADRGIRVYVLPYFYYIRPYVYPVHRRLKRGVKNFLSWCSSLMLARIAGKEKADIIHTNTSVNNIGYLTARRTGIPHIWHIREYNEAIELEIPHLKERLHDGTSYSITITRDLGREYGLSDLRQSRTIYNGIVKNLGEMPRQPKANYFLYVGNVDIIKGIDLCIEAFILFRKANPGVTTRLLVAGAPTNRGENLKQDLIGSLEENGIADSVEWLGNRSDVADLMQKALATVIASPKEGFGRVMAEAMSQGCLVIGRDLAGTHEQFENGLRLCGREIGLRYSSATGLARLMEEVSAASPESFDRMREDAFATVSELYSNEAYGCSVCRFYEEILSHTV